MITVSASTKDKYGRSGCTIRNAETKHIVALVKLPASYTASNPFSRYMTNDWNLNGEAAVTMHIDRKSALAHAKSTVA